MRHAHDDLQLTLGGKTGGCCLACIALFSEVGLARRNPQVPRLMKASPCMPLHALAIRNQGGVSGHWLTGAAGGCRAASGAAT